MMGQNPRCYIACFLEIGLLGSGKILKGVFTIYERGSHLGHVTQMLRTNFFPLPMEAPHKIWLLMTKRFQRRSLKMVYVQTEAGTWVHYKLTWWAYRLRWAKNHSLSFVRSTSMVSSHHYQICFQYVWILDFMVTMFLSRMCDYQAIIDACVFFFVFVFLLLFFVCLFFCRLGVYGDKCGIRICRNRSNQMN